MDFEGGLLGKREMVKSLYSYLEHVLHRYGFLSTSPGFLCWSFAGGFELIRIVGKKDRRQNQERKKDNSSGGIIQMLKTHQPPTQPCISAAATTVTITAYCQSARKEREDIPHRTGAKASHSNH